MSDDHTTRQRRRLSERYWKAAFLIGALLGAIGFTYSLWGWRGVGLLVCLFILWGARDSD